jgi:hypothetical protein
MAFKKCTYKNKLSQACEVPMENKKKHKFVVLRIIGIVLAAILIVLSVGCFIQSHNLAKPIHKLREATPICMKVDVSKPGVYSGAIDHSEHEEYAHLGVILYLEHESDLTFPEIFNEIEGKIETFDDDGKMITQFELYTKSPPHRLGSDNIKGYPPCWILEPFTAEQKTIKITVTKPVEKLGNTGQTFEGHYLLCGMELLPAGIATLCGLIFLGIGLLIILIIILVPIYMKRRHKKKLVG